MAGLAMTPNQHVPSIPSPVDDAQLPTPAEVGELDADAGIVVGRLHELIAETVNALRQLVDSRFGGPTWQEAEATDRRAVMAGREPTALAKLISTDPARYARAAALCSTLPLRMAAAREAGQGDLSRAAVAARAGSARLVSVAEETLPGAWSGRGTGRGLMLTEEAFAAVAAAGHLATLARWLARRRRPRRQRRRGRAAQPEGPRPLDRLGLGAERARPDRDPRGCAHAPRLPAQRRQLRLSWRPP